VLLGNDIDEAERRRFAALAGEPLRKIVQPPSIIDVLLGIFTTRSNACANGIARRTIASGWLTEKDMGVVTIQTIR
jgi:hypothetical protein